MIATLLAVCTFTLLLPAQVTSPPGYASREGLGHGFLFGASSWGRVMILDGEHRGRAMVIRTVSLRRDGFRAVTRKATGRSWTNVTLRVSECDINRASPIFTLNPTNTPTRVFSNAVSWPTEVGVPSKVPAPWGGRTGALRFPFSTTWVVLGNRDLCTDFDFAGGQMSNGAPWDTTTLWSYSIDSVTTGSFGSSFDALNVYGKSAWKSGCVDSGKKDPYAGDAQVVINTYAKSYRDPGRRDRTEVEIRSYHTANSLPVAHVLATRGTPAGTLFPGVSCNRLHVDLTAPHAILFFRASPTGALVHNMRFPAQPALFGQVLWHQVGWTDSRTGEFRLTNAMETEVPEQPKTYRRRVVHTRTHQAGLGRGPTTDHRYLPLIRY